MIKFSQQKLLIDFLLKTNHKVFNALIGFKALSLVVS